MMMLSQNGSQGDGAKWVDFRHSLKMELIRMFSRMYVWTESYSLQIESINNSMPVFGLTIQQMGSLIEMKKNKKETILNA